MKERTQEGARKKLISEVTEGNCGQELMSGRRGPSLSRRGGDSPTAAGQQV